LQTTELPLTPAVTTSAESSLLASASPLVSPGGAASRTHAMSSDALALGGTKAAESGSDSAAAQPAAPEGHRRAGDAPAV
jgi:hypothetical protein